MKMLFGHQKILKIKKNFDENSIFLRLAIGIRVLFWYNALIVGCCRLIAAGT